MDDLTVRPLGEDDWQLYRQVRLAALADAPDAFASSAQEEGDRDEQWWRSRMRRSSRLLAEREGRPVGIASVGQGRDAHDGDDGVAELFGMWVTPPARGSGVAWQLVDAAAEHVRAGGKRLLKLWVAADNGRAVAFYSSYGFRPADERRPMTTDHDVTELAMVLPVQNDPSTVPTTTIR